MEIDNNDDDILRLFAKGQPIEPADYAQWPRVLERLSDRLNKIIERDFPPPASADSTSSIATRLPSSSPPKPEDDSQISNASTSNNKENSSPKPQPPRQSNYTTYTTTLLASIISTLQSNFPAEPPHTIQRLSELLLTPTQHYRTLPSYLHALDRIIHVTSPLSTFPLPPAIPDPNIASHVLSNGAHSSNNAANVSWRNPTQAQNNNTLGSDESLGGALLTPITWLNKPAGSSVTGSSSSGGASPLEMEQGQGQVRTEDMQMVEGPNGMGGVETVSVSLNGVSSAVASMDRERERGEIEVGLRAEGGVTQGELLRQEQRAGVVPAAQLRGLGMGLNAGGMSASTTNGEEEEEIEVPHARGPEEIGVEDMGPQDGRGSGLGQNSVGIDVDAAVGRRRLETQDEDEVMGSSASEREGTPKRAAEEEIGADEKRVKEEIGEGEANRTGEPEIQAGEEGFTVKVKEVEEKEDTGEKKDMDADVDVDVDVKMETEAEAEIVDADGKTEDSKKIIENQGADS